MKKINKVLTTACLLTMVTWVNSLATNTSEIIESDLKSSVVKTLNDDDTTMKLNYEITPDDIDEQKTLTNIKNVFFAFKSNLLGDTALPASYNTVENLKSKKILLNVKNQYSTDSCWAFASNNVLNTYMATKLSAQNSNTYAQEYSVKHMDFGTSQNIEGIDYNKKGFYRNVGTPGNYNLAIAYWTNGLGAIKKMSNEDDFYSNYYKNSNYEMNVNELNQKQDLQINDVTQFATVMKSQNNGNIEYYSESGSQLDESTVTNLRKQIKENIKKYGAVTASTYGGTNGVNYMKKDENGIYNYYCPTNLSPNHAVTIVGWDDSYSKENFKTKPVHDGAYIVMNSYGTSFGNDGYYYISYDDANIENLATSITNVGEKDYDNIYQYDELYRSNVISTSSTNSAYMANVFKRKDNTIKEKLDSISVTLDRTCSVELYVNTNIGDNIDDNDWKNLRKVEIEGENILTSGFHRLKLKDNIELTNDRFIICAKMTATDSNGIGISLEDNVTTWYENVSANENEGFISYDNGESWIDVTKIKPGNGNLLSNASLCIKAFTINNGKNIQINVGNIYKIDEEKKYIYNISANTKTDEFEKVLKDNENANYTVKDTTNSLIKTGTIVEFADGAVYTAIVTGDINKDGVMNIIDLAKLKKYILSLVSLNDECKYASDLNKDGNVDIIDLARMKKELIK